WWGAPLRGGAWGGKYMTITTSSLKTREKNKKTKETTKKKKTQKNTKKKKKKIYILKNELKKKIKI
ncbi:hypothetical protein QL293_21460, partial [Bacillus subtilis]|uniref:hypothetical protein n=1 Tax=Bacillus subtilis TaxID=1423 RepID=UPI0024A948FC